MTRPASIRIPTGTLDCPACARRLEIRLAALPGVTGVRTGGASEGATVELESTGFIPAVLDALDAGGFESRIVSVSLPVWGLELAEPVMRVAEARLLADGAVRSARFDPASASLRVEYASGDVDLDAIRRTLEPFAIRTGHPSGSAPAEAAAHASRGAKLGWKAAALAGGASVASFLSAFMPVAAAADPIMSIDPLASAVRELGLVSPAVAMALSLVVALAGAVVAWPLFVAAVRDLRHALPTPRLLGSLAVVTMLLWSVFAFTTPWWSERRLPPMAGAALWSLAILHGTAALASRRRSDAAPAAAARDEDRGRTLAHWLGLAGIAVAILAAGVWLAARPRDPWVAVFAFSSILLATSSSAAALAAPISLQALVDRLAARGIRLRSRAAASVAARVRALVIDRRGGLTVAVARITGWILLDGTPQRELLRVAAAAEAGSNHPFGRAILQRASSEGRQAASSLPAGGGVEAEVSGEKLLAGSGALLASRGIAVDALLPEVAPFLERGETPCFVARQNRLLGAIVLDDPMRPSARPAIAGLRAAGITTILATADEEVTAARDAVLAGTSSFAFGLGVREKSALVSQTQEASGPVAWLSLPDEAAAPRADLSIAWTDGEGSADVVIEHNDFQALPELFAAARAEEKRRRASVGAVLLAQPVAWAIAGGALLPAAGLLPSPPLAALFPLVALAILIGRAR